MPPIRGTYLLMPWPRVVAKVVPTAPEVSVLPRGAPAIHPIPPTTL